MYTARVLNSVTGEVAHIEDVNSLDEVEAIEEEWSGEPFTEIEILCKDGFPP